MPWNIPVFDSTGKVKDARVGALQASGTPSIDIATASGIVADILPANIFVADNGLDSNPGTEGSPYLTIEKAQNVAVPGDIIEMQKNGGGTWTYTAFIDFDANGTDGNEIRLRVRAGDRVNFYPAAPRRELWLFSSASYWIFDGTLGEMYVGDRSLWDGNNDGGRDTYPHDLTIWTEGGENHHIDMLNVHFSGATEYFSLAINGDIAGSNESHHWRFKDCTMKNHGRLEIGFGETGDGISMGGHSHIIDNCDFEHFGGHNILQLCARRSLIRNNNFDADWNTTTSNPVGVGYRALALSEQITTGSASYDSEVPWGPCLFEGNIIQNAGWDQDVYADGDISNNNAVWKQGKSRLIFRYNYIWDMIGGDTAVQNSLQVDLANEPRTFPNCEYNSDYYNTYDSNRGIWYTTAATNDTGPTGTTIDSRGMIKYNNIHSNVTANIIARAGGFSQKNIILMRNTQRWDLQGFPDRWLGMKWVGNMIDSDEYGIHLANLTTPAESVRVTSLADAISEWPLVFDATNNTNAPTYVNAGARTKAGYQLDTGSNGLGEAEPMTTVTAGVTSTVISLNYAYWIYDGFDLSYFGSEYDADFIAIYDSDGTSNERIRQVLSVDSETSITLTASVTVANGDKIWPAPGGISPTKNVGAGQ